MLNPTSHDCSPATWAGRVGDDLWRAEATDDGLEVTTKNAYDPWSTWSPPIHLRSLAAGEES